MIHPVAQIDFLCWRTQAELNNHWQSLDIFYIFLWIPLAFGFSKVNVTALFVMIMSTVLVDLSRLSGLFFQVFGNDVPCNNWADYRWIVNHVNNCLFSPASKLVYKFCLQQIQTENHMKVTEVVLYKENLNYHCSFFSLIWMLVNLQLSNSFFHFHLLLKQVTRVK